MAKRLSNGTQEAINTGIQKDIEYIKVNLSEISTKLDSKYVTREEIDPMKKVVYGCVAITLTSVLSTVIYLAMHLPK